MASAPAQKSLGVPPRPAPFVFTENAGQWQSASRFIARTPQLAAHFEDRAIALQMLRGRPGDMRADVIRMEFEATAAGATLAGAQPRPGRFHYFTGADRQAWRTDVRAFAELRYRQLWPGVDLRVRDQGGILEYDVLLAPGADLSAVVVRCDGVSGLRLEADGRLALTTAGGVLHQSVPRSWAVDRAGRRTPVQCAFRLIDGQRFGFVAPELAADQALVIDPGLYWSTFLGGAGTDYAWRMVLEPNGDITLAGYTASATFPTTAGSYSTTYAGKIDAFVTRMAADGKSLRWSTLIGGSAEDWALGLAVGPNGEVAITGFTKSGNFPVSTGAFQSTNRGGFGEGFVAQLDKTGSKLNYSTFLGGTGWDYGVGVEMDRAGNATVIGITKSTDFPVTAGAYDTTHNGGGDGFVCRLDPRGSKLLFSTFLGSSGWDPLSDLVLDAQGNVFIVADIFGVSNTSNFPVTAGAFDTTYNDTSDRSDTIVCKLSADGRNLLWSTWLGGNSWDPGLSIVLDSAGNPTVCGESWSTDFPVTANAYQKTNKGLGDAYVARLSADGSKLLFATLFGGQLGEDRAFKVTIDPFDALVIAGFTASSDFPTTPGAISRTYKSKFDTFVVRFSPDGSKLYYSTLLGGTNNDHPYDMELTPYGEAVLTGDAYGPDFPTTAGSFDTTFNGRGDAFVAKLSVLPTGVERFGVSAPGCAPATPFGVTTQPRENAKDFALMCAGAPPTTSGLLVVGIRRMAAPVPFLGANLLVDFSMPNVQVQVFSDGAGRFGVPIPIGTGLKGTRVFGQFLWLNTRGCGGTGTLSSSDGLDLTVQ